MRKPFIAGNWKMYKTIAEAADFIDKFLKLYVESDVEVGFCVPYLQISEVKKLIKGTNIKIGAQNMHFEENGAFTGEISAPMLKEVGVDYCIIGHSERRQYFGETDDSVNKKIKKALEYDIIPIFCIGENLSQREAGEEYKIVSTQIKAGLKDLSAVDVEKLVVAYEPIWAIGTGKTATAEQANQMIGGIREVIRECYNYDVSEKVRIQYGGSVKPDNASELMNQEEIDGALVGGASLKPQDFIEIINF